MAHRQSYLYQLGCIERLQQGLVGSADQMNGKLVKSKLDRIRALLSSQTTLALATVGEDSLPRSTPLFFIANENLCLYWFSSRSSLHSRNCARNPEVSIAISNHACRWQEIQGVQMQGRVSIVTDRSLRNEIASAYSVRFQLGNLFAFTIRRSSLYCFTSSWVRYLDNSRRFGYKFELNLPANSCDR
jgi:uncharacterized protein YhbP (UPF0306 family)